MTGGAAPAQIQVVDAVLIWLARIGVYLGLFVGVGGVFFAAWIGQGPGGARVISGALAIGLVSALASLGLQGLDLLNLPFGAIADIGAVGERAGHQPRAFAVDCDRRDGDCVVRVEKPEHDDCVGADRRSPWRASGFRWRPAAMPRPRRRNG